MIIRYSVNSGEKNVTHLTLSEKLFINKNLCHYNNSFDMCIYKEEKKKTIVSNDITKKKETKVSICVLVQYLIKMLLFFDAISISKTYNMIRTNAVVMGPK